MVKHLKLTHRPTRKTMNQSNVTFCFVFKWNICTGQSVWPGGWGPVWGRWVCGCVCGGGGRWDGMGWDGIPKHHICEVMRPCLHAPPCVHQKSDKVLLVRLWGSRRWTVARFILQPVWLHFCSSLTKPKMAYCRRTSTYRAVTRHTHRVRWQAVCVPYKCAAAADLWKWITIAVCGRADFSVLGHHFRTRRCLSVPLSHFDACEPVRVGNFAGAGPGPGNVPMRQNRPVRYIRTKSRTTPCNLEARCVGDEGLPDWFPGTWRHHGKLVTTLNLWEQAHLIERVL